MKLFRLFLAAICLLPMSGFAWNIQRIQSDPSFPGVVKVSVDVNATVAAGELDLVLVVDDSGSMSTHQNMLAKNIHTFIEPILTAGWDMNVGVMTTSMQRFNGDAYGGRFHKGWLHSSSSTFLQDLRERILVGVNGEGTEQHFAAIQAGLSEPVISAENKGFLRPGAELGVIFVTDAEDQSLNSARELAAFLIALKGDANLVHVGALYIPSSEGKTSTCQRDDSSALPVRLEEFLGLFDNVTANLCDPNVSEKVKELSKLFQPAPKKGTEIREVILPSEAAFETIQVIYGRTTLMAGDVDYGWTYNSRTRAVKIGELFDFTSEPRSTLLEITYVPKDWK